MTDNIFFFCETKKLLILLFNFLYQEKIWFGFANRRLGAIGRPDLIGAFLK